ncbi:MAG TPA: hypothetical protein VJA65_04075, partial [bacterium]|nr:hypothetical protein [bacterium]
LPEAARRIGEMHYVPRPGTDRWVRLGEMEWRLLQTLQRKTGPAAAPVAVDIPGWSPDQLAAAVQRFAALGLLAPGAVQAAETRTAGRPALLGLLAAGLVTFLLGDVIAVARTVPWPAWIAGRPPGWLAAILVLMMAAAHEAGHAAIALAVGAPAAALRVTAGRLGWIPIPTVRVGQFWALSNAARTAVVLGGAGAQLLLAALAGSLWLVWPLVGAPPPAVLLWLQSTAIILAAANLLPVYPLDGYWLIAVRLDRPRLREESRVVRLSSEAGVIVLSGLTVLWVVWLLV